MTKRPGAGSDEKNERAHTPSVDSAGCLREAGFVRGAAVRRVAVLLGSEANGFNLNQ
ncbi:MULTISPECIES: hypothetical protein [Burkholderia cepacia complex]|uniref:hypothetical protein n=1 Tax=Burkholderia cepacia complex TaxID=87882 RepID=UPI001E4A694B|nr:MULTISPECIES: hypothetical protein [Burkholderia cepacia complex]